ncbi:hypothetical protein [Rhizobium sp. S163]|uniref:hypothetical protein n=1 Tax=Rhizobium sp. S163 TaxID=3055039 RepID=UPI0025A9F95F|nr:hypothetical protein [Rhizobium sp. S163]MDM9647836.1 hypothetical protein [Rhizobium sp. S163]
MFAGRYLWWMLIALAVFLFFAMSFDYVTWATVATSSCARVAGSCGPLILTMTGTIKPIGYYIPGGIILVITFARIHHIGMSWLWCLFVLVLFGASAPFPLLLANVWTGQMNSEMVMQNLPVAFPFLVVFCTYIGWSFEDGGGRPLGPWRWLRVAIRFSALYGAMIALAQTPAFAWMPGRLLDMPALSVLLATWQPKLETVLTLGALDDRMAYLALAVFSVALAASLFGPRVETLGARLMTPFMLRGSRR